MKKINKKPKLWHASSPKTVGSR